MNNLPVVRSPWRIVIPGDRLYLPVCADADAGDSLVQQLQTGHRMAAGWSTRWYSELFHDDAMMSAVG